MSTEEQSVDNKKEKIPLKENQTSTEARTQTPTKDSIGDHREEVNPREVMASEEIIQDGTSSGERG